MNRPAETIRGVQFRAVGEIMPLRRFLFYLSRGDSTGQVFLSFLFNRPGICLRQPEIPPAGAAIVLVEKVLIRPG